MFPSRRVAAFMHGCFWHQHPGCRRVKLPQTRADFWREKLEAHVERDATALAAAGWTALVAWECAPRPQALELLYEHIMEVPVTR